MGKDQKDAESKVNHDEVVVRFHPNEMNFMRYWAAFEDMTVENFIHEAACWRCQVFEQNVSRANATRKKPESNEDKTNPADNVVELMGQGPDATIQ